MKIKAKLASLAAVAIIVGTQYPIASNAEQPVLQGGDYIVVFDNQANEQAEAAKLRGQGANVTYTYSAAFKGLAGTFNSAQLVALQKNPNVKWIEKDSTFSINGDQPNPTWGLNRIDQVNLPLDTKYSYTSVGNSVKAYVIDTGINTTHVDFVGRIGAGANFVSDRRGVEDCNGHGTHVAGTIGGTTYGVAKSVTLIPVRVLNCQGSGTTSGVAAGIDWVAANNKGAVAVANLSLGGGISSTIDTAISNLVVSGVVVVVAAGNSSADACTSSPARVPSAITVGASDSSDKQASFSNFGTCVDIYAPGVGIKSDWIKSSTATNTISGTSMASPHVAGVVARYLQNNTTATPADVSTALKSAASITVSGATAGYNKLVYMDPSK